MINWDAYTDFWYFINERHRIYLTKEISGKKPYTNDPIFQQWKFCNVFRRLDKQSKWLIDNVITPHCHPEYDDPALMLFNIFAFRAFNYWPTYDALVDAFAEGIWLQSWDKNIAIKALKELEGQLTSGAYMLRGREGQPKYVSICDTLDEIWDRKEKLLESIQLGVTLQNAYEHILSSNFWGWGPFTSYQIALDLTYTPILEDPVDINEWCAFGPGAKRGLREIWPDLVLKEEWMIEAAKSLLADQVKYREGHVPELNLQDIEFCLCELSKYRRIKRGGRGKEKYAGIAINRTAS